MLMLEDAEKDEDMGHQSLQTLSLTYVTLSLAPLVVRPLPANQGVPERGRMLLVAHVLVPAATSHPEATWFFDHKPLSSQSNFTDYQVLCW